MRIRFGALGYSLLVLSVGTAGCDEEAFRRHPTGAFASARSALPWPPRQQEAWDPPQGALPAIATSAIATLFEQGLADPRGLPYRAIALRVRTAWGTEQIIRTRGWVLEPRFAVTWSGLVVPIEEAGGAADLRADVERMIARDEETRAREARDWPTHGFYRFRQAWSEEASASAETLLPIRAALLLRLGEGDLARRVWEAWHIGMSAGTNDDAAHLAGPYLMLALDWTWALFDRAVNAHALGDDGLARATAERLAPIRADVNRVARERGFTVEGSDYLPFLEPLEALRADQLRRSRPATPPADRIGAAIAKLEDVAERQMSQPGGVDLARDPRVQALVREGEPAIEPLLVALENDVRLTRSVSFHRDFSRGRHLIAVAEVVYAALTEILGSQTIAADRQDLATLTGRRAAAAALRAFAQEHRGQAPADRWYAVLGDDRATRDQWIEAARSIVGTIGTSGARGWGSAARPPPRATTLPGEALRSRAPSVSALLLRRLDALARDTHPVGGGTPYRVNVLLAGQIAMALGAWDPEGGREALRAEVDRAEHFIAKADPLQDDFDAEYAALLIAQHTLALVRGGDAEALGRFTRWLRAVPIAKLGTNVRHVLEPMWTLPDQPEIQSFLRWAFHDPRSPFLPLIGRGSGARDLDLLQTPLVDVPIFRERVLLDLADRGVGGTLRPLSGNGYTVEYRGWRLTGQADGTLAMEEPVLIRTCDVTAEQLTSMFAPEDAPRFRIYWPTAERDRAIAALVDYLRAHAGR
jgi:hypothetical protein